MSTLKVAAINNPSAPSGGLAISASGLVTGGGLDLIAPASIANSGGSASSVRGTTTFTSVTSISLNGVFTSAYANYLILFAYTSPDVNVLMRLRAAGTDATGANYNVRELSIAGSVTSSVLRGGTSFGMGYTGSAGTYQEIKLFGPQLSAATGMAAYLSLDRASQTEASLNSGNHTLATGYDGFTYAVGSSTLSGTVRVYGFQNG